MSCRIHTGYRGIEKGPVRKAGVTWPAVPVRLLAQALALIGEATMRQELMFWLRVAAVALGAMALVAVVVSVGGPATEIIALR
jgi:hypothetical protein